MGQIVGAALVSHVPPIVLPAAERLPTNRIVGDTASVVERLDDLARRTGADELMLSTVAHDVAVRCRSLVLVAGAWAARAPA